MAVRRNGEHTYYTSTRGLCTTCKKGVEAKVQFREDRVWLDKYCSEHGHQSTMIASSVEWYLDALSFVAPADPPRGPTKPVEKGCPNDCGPCKSHQQKVALPVVPITSACNLDCPICYTVNKNEDAFHLSKERFAQILAHLRARDEELDIINFTGGEPTLHPDLPGLLRMAREAGIRRLTISTNGLKLTNEDYVQALAAEDARIVLSLDTFDDEVDRIMLGATTVKTKLKVLDLLAKHDVTTTILPAIAAGLNDKDLPRLFQTMIERPNVVSLELHTLTFTGQGGVDFDRKARITTPDLHRILTEATNGRLTSSDFVPSPLAHPHCYSIAYLLMLDDGSWVPMARVIGREGLFDMLGDSLYVQPRERTEELLREAMDRIWADPDSLPQADLVLSTLKRLIGEMFPQRPVPLAQRQKIAERSTKAVYIHSHMDEESFELGRIMRCSVGVPEADGSNIPTCAYNVLYREKDARFAAPENLARIRLHRDAPAL